MGFPFWVAIMGIITGSLGVLRDICINEIPLIFRKDVYVMACLAGGVIYGHHYFGVKLRGDRITLCGKCHRHTSDRSWASYKFALHSKRTSSRVLCQQLWGG